MEHVPEPALTPELIRDRWDRLHERLRSAARGAGREPDGFRVVAVTKGFELSAVRAARAAGLTVFGENRVQEAVPKVEALPAAEWHMIGRLQSNKVRHALELFGTIHSVESLELLQRIERIAHDHGHHPRLLLQVDTSAAGGRVGFAADWFVAQARDSTSDLVRAVQELHAAQVIGLMTMVPIDGTPPSGHFAALRELRDALQSSSGLPLPELSMGMTADAEEAVAEGASLLRIGTAIFGPRPHR
ncbi:MAG TPA: YggS family pyridoxal phosphate-dependent enzyme [Candidatus Limnocylindria bacterium]